MDLASWRDAAACLAVPQIEVEAFFFSYPLKVGEPYSYTYRNAGAPRRRCR
ncbi:hypothetical protein ACIGGE_12190 [Qipengyuania sp. NPDC077410]|uniref:hypothetical protein n=1 Tax=Qipengyuania sp. NPDC077410 TaxID=3364496 RepID=UPI0037C9B2A0